MRNQKGFSVVEGILIVLVVALIGFGGYYVWNQQNDKGQEQSEAVKKEDTIAQNTEETKEPTIETPSMPDNWVSYDNSEYGFSFKHPEGLTLTEQDDAYYFQVSAIKDDGNNPALNVYGENNYKIQVQYNKESLTLKEIIARGVDGDIKEEVTTIDGLDRAITSVSSEDIQGPGYDIYWLGRGENVLSVIVIGNPDFETETLLSSFTLN